MIYYETHSTDPHFNLAMEEHLFNEMDPTQNYLMLWQNDNSVIIGRFQNTAAELNAPFVQQHKVNVVRRLSGGGAVYHDLGNLNFTFIRSEENLEKFDFAFFTKPLVDTLASFGVRAELSGRNDVTVDGRKFSGNAQYAKRGRIMHHGTIMFSSDLTVLSSALNVGGDKLQSKAVASVRSRVANLCEFITDAGLPELKAAFLQQMDKTEGVVQREFSADDVAAAKKLQAEKYDLWDWNYGASPPYTVQKSRRVEGCGRIEAYLQIEKGRITSFATHGDYFGREDIAPLAARLCGVRAEKGDVLAALEGLDVGDFYRNLTAEALADIITE